MANTINQIVIMDNGAHTIKVGFYNDNNPKIVPNCITKVRNEKRRPFIADQLEECKDYSGMFFILPFNKGYLLNWEIQKQIWDHIFRNILKLQPDKKGRFSDIGLLITEPVYNFPQITKLMISTLFEEYGFGKILISNAPQLSAFAYLYEQNKHGQNLERASNEIACLVVDSGYSFTHVVPIVEGHRILQHTKRIDVGGKALTNHLKEIISYRQINVLDETYVVNQMKEDCCYVSMDLWKDLELAKKHPVKDDNPIVQDYILPDYVVHKRGFVFDHRKHPDLNTNDYQLIRMNNERFQVPELLFHPSDVNIDQLGISETIVFAISEFNPNFQPISYINAIESGSGSMHTSRERPDNLKDIDSSSSEDEDEEYEDDESTVTSEDSKTKENKDDVIVDLSIYDDENIQAHLYNNILLIGGNCRFPNFKDRLHIDLRSYVPDILDVRVTLPDNPITYAWYGGKILCSINDNGEKLPDHNGSLFHKYALSRKEYNQNDLDYCQEKFSKYRMHISCSNKTATNVANRKNPKSTKD